MIVVKVELWSANTGQKTELARMTISNVGCSPDMKVRDYGVGTLLGRSKEALDKSLAKRSYKRYGEVIGHRSLSLHVWHLVSKALLNIGYGPMKRTDTPNLDPEVFQELAADD